MRSVKALLFAAIMITTVAFSAELISSDNSFSAGAQTVTVRRKRKPGIARRTYRGGRYVVRRVYVGGKWVTKKVWVGTKWTGRKSWRTGRKVVSRSKKVIY